ncbi:aromatic ring-hydroxylating oxygenase subunit alpha [Henriciella aquimarina]|uniref:aromatic ring-hydroxylating oxygenase subunit alpha n=1 Tax=Henriciella aquimarina TaxID=545261 RepID=UPI000A057D2C|nr:aromatic ring-hydroxylating dioxygenase subunit alpha [Henriciella aquimarina]
MNIIDTGERPTTKESASPKLKRVQCLTDLSEDQIRAIRAIPAHEAAKPEPINERRPAAMFTAAERFELEQKNVFRKRAVPVTLSAMLPEKNSYFPHDGYGVPIVVTRDQNGQVHAFLNACMHKGSKVVEGCEARKGKLMVCPYHAWSFATDGRLIAVPREESIIGLDKSNRGLRELACKEAGGIIWVMLDPAAEPDFGGMDQQLIKDFEALDIPRMEVYGRKTFELEANWKLVLEPFLEGYHVTRLHANTVGPMFPDVPNANEILGLNVRQLQGKVNFTPEGLDVEGENIHKSVTFSYIVFPNLVVITSPYYISAMYIMPKAANRSTVEYIMLTRQEADNEKAKELYSKSYDMVLNVFGNEDFRAAEISQQGLSTGALDDVIYTGLEAAIPAYYRLLESHFS